MCGSSVGDVVGAILDPILPDPPKIKVPQTQPPPPPPPMTQPFTPEPPAAPVIGGQQAKTPAPKSGRAALVIPINIGGLGQGSGLNVPR